MGRRPPVWVLLTALIPAVAHATILANWNLDEVVAHADLVVIGTVGESRVVQVGARVLTETEIQVERTLLGSSAATLVVSQPGGRLGSVATIVVGTVIYRPGARVLLATSLAREGRRYVIGFSLGAYYVFGHTLRQTIDVPLAEPGGVILAPPGERVTSLEAVEAAIARRRP